MGKAHINMKTLLEKRATSNWSVCAKIADVEIIDKLVGLFFIMLNDVYYKLYQNSPNLELICFESCVNGCEYIYQ